MKSSFLWRVMRDARYALPERAGRLMPVMDDRALAAFCCRLQKQGMDLSAGYFESAGEDADTIAAQYQAAMRHLREKGCAGLFAVKAPPLGFSDDYARRLAGTGAQCWASLIFDAHGPGDADATLALVERLLPEFPATGVAIPARWRRSVGDASRFYETSARIRVVKGEWAEVAGEDDLTDADQKYLNLVTILAGRKAPVAVATHRPEVAERALAILLEAGTPCELEQLRGLPRKRTVSIARRLGVPVRVYVPFGPGWWPYAIDKALARPYLPLWWMRDVLGFKG